MTFHVMGGKKRDGAGNRVGSGKKPRLKPGAKKAVKSGAVKPPSKPPSVKEKKNGATVYKKADGSKTVVKKKANGATRVVERNSKVKRPALPLVKPIRTVDILPFSVKQAARKLLLKLKV